MRKDLFLISAMLLCQQLLLSRQVSQNYCCMFYNVENLFHPSVDTVSGDDENFTPGGTRRWTFYRYNKKVAEICKVILAVNGWDPPEIICFSEIENRKVLADIATHPLLVNFSYGIIHRDSPDHRGIDVGMLYRTGLADCIVHVIDAGRADWAAQRADVIAVLEEMGIAYARDARVVEVYNKADALEPEAAAALAERVAHGPVPALVVSAARGQGLEALRALLAEVVHGTAQAVEVTLEPTQGRALAWLYAHGRVVARRDTDAAVHLRVLLTPGARERFQAETIRFSGIHCAIYVQKNPLHQIYR